MREVTFHWDDGEDGEINIEITVSRATMQMGIDRLKLVAKAEGYLAEKENKYLAYVLKVAGGQMKAGREEMLAGGSDVDFALWLACANYYPSCIAGTKSIQNADDAKTKLSLDLSIDEFLYLDEQLVATWFIKVMALNPHWDALRNRKDADQGEAKAPATADG